MEVVVSEFCSNGYGRLKRRTAAATATIAGMTLERAAWLFAVLASATVATILFLSGYQGYGWIAIAVGLAASVNLFGSPPEDQ